MEKLTADSIRLAHESFIRGYQACIDEVLDGRVHVENVRAYIVWRCEQMDEHRRGMHEHTFTFWQRAYEIQTGQCVPFFKE